MQAIEVKYLEPTTYKGSRWKATCKAGNITVPYKYSLGAFENAELAALALQHKLGWEFSMVGGCLPNDNYVFVLTSPHNENSERA